MDKPLIDDCIRELGVIARRLDQAGMAKAATRISEALDALGSAASMDADEIDRAAASLLSVPKRTGTG